MSRIVALICASSQSPQDGPEVVDLSALQEGQQLEREEFVMSGNVFISWSGNTSKAVAEALRDWLPSVVQAIKPWMSSEDIDKGSRWSSEISGKLKETKIGVICLTPDNLNAPWILFEAGALSKTVEDTFVCPYLFRLEAAEVKGPLAQFQLTKADKEDTKKLLGTINRSLGESALKDEQLNVSFEKWWPDLEQRLRVAGEQELEGAIAPERTDRDILEEILAHVRGQARRLKEQQDRERQDRIFDLLTGRSRGRSSLPPLPRNPLGVVGSGKQLTAVENAVDDLMNQIAHHEPPEDQGASEPEEDEEGR